ncbi:hypothetical protein SAMN04487948_104154 [Halogranum amylolyticum]|uniref:Uncharacterized protein n=1 Tax=Halogranum amylolyticum TaxID=660520 RepID=A0A1H8RPV2_9EURY|nr:hypothetical protein [Halogranum amylolyticum]SEO68208.1 hypothetical protein SAMN04487948_104154 [Halogranum amylolyticum]
MVGPSLTDEEKRSASLQFKLVFVLVVGVSAAVLALQVQGSLVQVAATGVGGLLVGWILIAYLSHIVPSNGRYD